MSDALPESEPAVSETQPKPLFDRPIPTELERPPFWRRILAFVIDGLIIGVAAWIAGFLFGSWLSALGPWGRVAGGLLGVAYFGIGYSKLTHGRTPGKRITRIAVTHRDGNYLSIPAGFVRAAMLMLPLACNGLAIATASWVVPTITSAVVFGLGGGTLYLFLFNRQTRQGLHDLATASIVVPIVWGEAQRSRRVIWRGHYVAMGAVLLGSFGLISIAALIVRNRVDFSSLLEAQRNIVALTDSTNVQVTDMSSFGSGGRQTWLKTTVVTYSPRSEPERLANGIAAIILRDIPDASNRSRIVVTTVQGFDIVFASSWYSQTWNYTPAEWQERIR